MPIDIHTKSIPDNLHSILLKTSIWTMMTGAGISAESGVPTFRDAQTGLWANYRPEELASPEGFLSNPERVWNWYEHRRNLISQARPNEGHKRIASLANHIDAFHLITQNVDGLHQRAGSTEVIELHGNIHRTLCFENGHEIKQWLPASTLPPKCPRCHSYLRPGVVWFGESLPMDAMRKAESVASTCEVFFSVGTSSVVYPAAGLAHAAKQAGAILIEINPDETPLSHVTDFAFRMSASQALAIIDEHRQQSKDH
jgi:NAD-dependent deacetylase